MTAPVTLTRTLARCPVCQDTTAGLTVQRETPELLYVLDGCGHVVRSGTHVPHEPAAGYVAFKLRETGGR